ncbi:MAG: pyruvoyl-dependent arginine decarboxylase [Candidatus Aenigmatarchaeota archaeon]
MSIQPFYWPVAKKFFMTKGCAYSDTPKGAMQEALKKAGIHRANIIEVSSVLDPDAEELPLTGSNTYDTKTIPHAAFALSVFAHYSGTESETIGAGVGAAWMKSKEGERKAYVVEASGNKTVGRIKNEVMLSLVDIAEAENLTIYPKPGSKAEKPLLGRKEWERKEEGRKFRNPKAQEREYVKYLGENSNDYFRIEADGISGIPDDYGYAAAALVYVMDMDTVAAPIGEYLKEKGLLK